MADSSRYRFARLLLIVGAAFVAPATSCGGRTGLRSGGSDAGVTADAAVTADAGVTDAALDGSCAFPQVDAACVAAGSGVVLFGWTAISAPDYLSATWTWDGTSWTQKYPVSPSARDNATMARLNDTGVLFGGSYDSYIGPTGGVLSDTWVWDGSCWAQQFVPGPNAREYAAMATLGNTVVLFGGLGWQSVQGDTWTWNGACWVEIDTQGPGARSGHAMATLHDAIVLFGGKNGDPRVLGGPLLGDTWTWNGTRWTQLDVKGPSARTGAAMATLDDVVVLFGGVDESGSFLGDTWTWDGKTWTQMDVAGPMGDTNQASMPNLMATFDGAVVLLSGFYQTGAPGRTWTWNGTSWTQLQVPGPDVLESWVQSAVTCAW